MTVVTVSVSVSASMSVYVSLPEVVRISLCVSDRIGGGMPVFVVQGFAIVSSRPCECLSVRFCAIHRVMHFS